MMVRQRKDSGKSPDSKDKRLTARASPRPGQLLKRKDPKGEEGKSTPSKKLNVKGSPLKGSAAAKAKALVAHKLKVSPKVVKAKLSLKKSKSVSKSPVDLKRVGKARKVMSGDKGPGEASNGPVNHTDKNQTEAKPRVRKKKIIDIKKEAANKGTTKRRPTASGSKEKDKDGLLRKQKAKDKDMEDSEGKSKDVANNNQSDTDKSVKKRMVAKHKGENGPSEHHETSESSNCNSPPVKRKKKGEGDDYDQKSDQKSDDEGKGQKSAKRVKSPDEVSRSESCKLKKSRKDGSGENEECDSAMSGGEEETCANAADTNHVSGKQDSPKDLEKEMNGEEKPHECEEEMSTEDSGSQHGINSTESGAEKDPKTAGEEDVKSENTPNDVDSQQKASSEHGGESPGKREDHCSGGGTSDNGNCEANMETESNIDASKDTKVDDRSISKSQLESDSASKPAVDPENLCGDGGVAADMVHGTEDDDSGDHREPQSPTNSNSSPVRQTCASQDTQNECPKDTTSDDWDQHEARDMKNEDTVCNVKSEDGDSNQVSTDTSAPCKAIEDTNQDSEDSTERDDQSDDDEASVKSEGEPVPASMESRFRTGSPNDPRATMTGCGAVPPEDTPPRSTPGREEETHIKATAVANDACAGVVTPPAEEDKSEVDLHQPHYQDTCRSGRTKSARVDPYDLVDEDVQLPMRPSGTAEEIPTIPAPHSAMSGEARCERCGMIWPTAAKLIKHLESCTGATPPPSDGDDKRYKCVKCDFHSKWAFLVRRHQVNHGIFACQHCNETRCSEEELQDHLKDVHPQKPTRIPCPKCGASVVSGHAYDRHMDKCPGREALICPLCKKGFKQEIRLKKHIAQHEGRTEYFQCDKCEYKTNIKCNLKKHQAVVHTDEPGDFTCSECGKKFTTAGYLKRHMRVHTEGRPHVCHLCSKAFTTAPYLANHLQTHNAPDAVPCTEKDCDRAFKTTKLMNKHRLEFHGLGVKQYLCMFDGCDMVFYKETHYKRHMASHTGERKFVCDWEDCGKAFRHADNLKVHKRQHTDEKPFKCDRCGFRCRQKSSLQWHQKKHCPMPEGSDESHEGRRPYQRRKKSDLGSQPLKANPKPLMNDFSSVSSSLDSPSPGKLHIASPLHDDGSLPGTPSALDSDLFPPDMDEDQEDAGDESMEDFSDVLPQGGYDDGEVMFKAAAEAAEVLSDELSRDPAALDDNLEDDEEDKEKFGEDNRVLDSPISDEENTPAQLSLPPRPQDSPTLGASRASTETSAESLQSPRMSDGQKYPGQAPGYNDRQYAAHSYPEHSASAMYYSEPSANDNSRGSRAEVSVISLPPHIDKQLEEGMKEAYGPGNPMDDDPDVHHNDHHHALAEGRMPGTDGGLPDSLAGGRLSQELPSASQLAASLPEDMSRLPGDMPPDAILRRDMEPRHSPWMEPPPAHQQPSLYSNRDLPNPAHKDMYGELTRKDPLPGFKEGLGGYKESLPSFKDGLASYKDLPGYKDVLYGESNNSLDYGSSKDVPSSDPLAPSSLPSSSLAASGSLSSMPPSSGQYPQYSRDYASQFSSRGQEGGLLPGAGEFYNQLLPECSTLSGDRYMSSSQPPLTQTSAMSSGLPPSALPPPPDASFQALQRTNAELLRRAYGSPELHQGAGQWGAQEPTARHWPDLASGSKESHYYNSMDPSGARQLGKPSSFGMGGHGGRDPVSDASASSSLPGSLDSHMMASMYMGRHFPGAGSSGSYQHPVAKGYEDSYRSPHMADYRTLQQAPDMFGRMSMPPSALGLDKYYYARDSMYRSQALGGSAPFLPPSANQIPAYPPSPAERDYSRSSMYPQPPTPYAALMGDKQYLSAHKLPPPGMPSLADRTPAPDYYGSAPPPPPPAAQDHFQDPYRRSVIYNMMNRYLS